MVCVSVCCVYVMSRKFDTWLSSSTLKWEHTRPMLPLLLRNTHTQWAHSIAQQHIINIQLAYYTLYTVYGIVLFYCIERFGGFVSPAHLQIRRFVKWMGKKCGKSIRIKKMEICIFFGVLVRKQNNTKHGHTIVSMDNQKHDDIIMISDTHNSFSNNANKNKIQFLKELPIGGRDDALKKSF